jgi:hypothetical protein
MDRAGRLGVAVPPALRAPGLLRGPRFARGSGLRWGFRHVPLLLLLRLAVRAGVLFLELVGSSECFPGQYRRGAETT